MKNPTVGELQDQGLIMAAIGHVCLQWARLEMALLGILVTIDIIPLAKGEIIFGGLDIIPRVNMAINLARYEKLPPPLTRRLMAIRKALQEGLADRRNQVVHGAHKAAADSGSVTLTMVRWKGDKRDRTMSIYDLRDLGVEILDLGNEAFSLKEDIAAWKFKPRPQRDL